MAVSLPFCNLLSAPFRDHGDFRMPQGKGFAEMTVISVLIVVSTAIIMMMVRTRSPRD